MYPINTHRGFTLIEMSMVLFIIGLTVAGLLEISVSMMKRAEVKESQSMVNVLKERIIGYALSNQKIPKYESGAGIDQLTDLGFKNRDFWGNKLNYIYDPQLVRVDLASICGKSTTNIDLRQCSGSDLSCTTYTTQKNVAFIVFSRGANTVNQTGASTNPHQETSPDSPYSGPAYSGTAVSAVISTYPLGMQVGRYDSTSTNLVDNDDITSIVTLDELRQKLACQGTPLHIINPDLPMGSSNTTYVASIYADGGVPISPSTSGKYRWCAESSTVASFNSSPALAQTAASGVYVAVTVGSIGSCSTALENSTSWVQGDNFRIKGAGGTPANSLNTTTAGTHDITVFVRDDQNSNSPLLATPDPADNIVFRRFVLAISGI